MGDDDNGNDKSYESDSCTWDFGGEETQIFDSQFSDSPTSSSGNKFNVDGTEQLHILESTIPFDDTVVCEEDELATQVMDHPDGETQPFNLDGETQVVNFDTEFELIDFPDSVEKNETQLFNDCDTEEVVVTDHEGTENTEIVDDSDDDDLGTRDCANTTDIEPTQEYNSKTENQRSEQHTSGFGFKKFTSIRAASLRASGLAALNKAPQRHNSPSSLNNKLINKPETENRFGFIRSTARKLFAEDAIDKTKEANDDFALREASNSPILETGPVGLSYIDSQEPGDASQENALDFVNNFLKVNNECCNERDFSKSTGGKSKPVLSVEGTRTFAKSANLINAVDEIRIFDWDNNREDEGGGEFYRKKKDAFFASGGRKLKSSSFKSGRKLGESDSKLVLGNRKGDVKSRKSLGTHIKDASLRKNLIDELDKQSTDMPGGMDIQEKIQEARFDTQMAAEAMEDLCFGLQETVHDKSQTPVLSKDGVRTTRSKSKRSVDQSKKSENLDNVSSDVAKRRGKMSLKRREVGKVDQISVKKQCIQNVTPVARRTRQSVKDNNEFDIVKDVSTDRILPQFYPKRKRSFQKSPSARKVSTQSVSRSTRSKGAILTEQETGRGTHAKDSLCTTPLSRGTHGKESSPICMGDEYLKQSLRRSSLIQEVMNVSNTGTTIISPNKDTRKRKDVSLIRVLFSRHLDGDIIKHQKKILSRLGASESSSMSDATHFITDDFVRTRNMLEAIAVGKPVVTHLWLESCGQACCHIDEKNFVLRDAKKEKEFGFSLPATLARARQNPLLKGHRVLITQNTKPGKEILSSLVKAVHGVAVERIGRSGLKDDRIPEGLLILSCEEDYSVCLPFLEKGAAIYSSELLLNGIVTQRLEYQRHRLFSDHVKRTRSTIWLKKDDNQFKPVSKLK